MKKFPIALIVAACMVMSACSNPEEEAKKLGFSNVTEMNEFKERGYSSINEYNKAKEFSPKKYLANCMSLGYDEFKSKCEGKKVIWNGVILANFSNFPSKQKNLRIVIFDDGLPQFTVDSIDLADKISDEDLGKDIEFEAIIGWEQYLNAVKFSKVMEASLNFPKAYFGKYWNWKPFMEYSTAQGVNASLGLDADGYYAINQNSPVRKVDGKYREVTYIKWVNKNITNYDDKGIFVNNDEPSIDTYTINCESRNVKWLYTGSMRIKKSEALSEINSITGDKSIKQVAGGRELVGFMMQQKAKWEGVSGVFGKFIDKVCQN